MDFSRTRLQDTKRCSQSPYAEVVYQRRAECSGPEKWYTLVATYLTSKFAVHRAICPNAKQHCRERLTSKIVCNSSTPSAAFLGLRWNHPQQPSLPFARSQSAYKRRHQVSINHVMSVGLYSAADMIAGIPTVAILGLRIDGC